MQNIDQLRTDWDFERRIQSITENENVKVVVLNPEESNNSFVGSIFVTTDAGHVSWEKPNGAPSDIIEVFYNATNTTEDVKLRSLIRSELEEYQPYLYQLRQDSPFASKTQGSSLASPLEGLVDNDSFTYNPADGPAAMAALKNAAIAASTGQEAVTESASAISEMADLLGFGNVMLEGYRDNGDGTMTVINVMDDVFPKDEDPQSPDLFPLHNLGIEDQEALETFQRYCKYRAQPLAEVSRNLFQAFTDNVYIIEGSEMRAALGPRIHEILTLTSQNSQKVNQELYELTLIYLLANPIEFILSIPETAKKYIKGMDEEIGGVDYPEWLDD